MQVSNEVSKILFFPLDVNYLANGNILITDGGSWDVGGWGEARSKVLEITRSGEIVWVYDKGLIFAHSARRLKSGHTLITDTGNNRVIEVSPNNEVVWDTSYLNNKGTLSDGSSINYPNDAHLLYNGRILISERNNDRITEIDKEGNICWQYDRSVHQHGVQRLANGNTLFADSERNYVVELDMKGNNVWQYGGDGVLNWPRDADRLSNGNTLIADTRNNRILEVSKAGEVLWSYATPRCSSLYEVEEGPEGHILYSDCLGRQVVEIDRHGNILWTFRNYYFNRKPLSNLVNGDFAEIDPDIQLPKYWTSCIYFSERGGSIKVDREETENSNAVKLETDRRGFLMLHQTLAAEPKRPYLIKGIIKSKDLEEFAQIQAAFLDSEGSYMHGSISANHPGGFLVKGTQDWKEVGAVIWSPSEATAVDIRCFLMNSGEAWFSNISFEAL